MRRLRAAAAAVALLVAATGCEAVVGTDVTVTGVDEVRTEVAVTLTGAAAEAFGEDAKLLARLERLVEDRAGTTTARTVEDDLVEFRARVEPGRVADASGLTGVAGISATGTGEGTAAVRIDAVPPVELRSALADTPDQAAVPLLLDNTVVRVRVFTGGVSSVGGIASNAEAGVEVTSEEGVVTFSRTVSSDTAGTLELVAAPVGGRPWWVLVGAAAAAAGLVALVRVARAARRD